MTKNDDDPTIKILRDQGFEPIVEGGRYETIDEVYTALADLVDNIESHSERCDCDLCELSRQLERIIPEA